VCECVWTCTIRDSHGTLTWSGQGKESYGIWVILTTIWNGADIVACMHLCVYVYSQNCRTWSSISPYFPWGVVAQWKHWHVVWSFAFHVGGLSFFTRSWLLSTTRNLIVQLILLLDELKQDCLLCVQGANYTMVVLAEFLRKCVISKKLWPLWSLDLTSQHFYFWCYIKQNVHREPTQAGRISVKH
jgi:hypothetical protein